MISILILYTAVIGTLRLLPAFLPCMLNDIIISDNGCKNTRNIFIVGMLGTRMLGVVEVYQLLL